MFYPIENGSVLEVSDNAFGFVYKCQLPPLGYGKSSATGNIEQVDCLEFPDNKWVRPTLPADYKARRKKEKEVQKIHPRHFDPYLQDIRKREWKRRLCGVWVKLYNPKKKEAEWVYLTGLHYFYITYWKFQGKMMDYRVPDRDFFYVIAYCMEDPNCLGLNELTKRKNGKTARVGCWLYERTSRMNDHHGGIQSKADDDAQEVLWKAVVQPWQHLPDFFRPLYDTMKGDAPKDELRFFATSRRGSKTEEEPDDIEEALNSFIDFKPSSEAAYDGPELHSYVSDESGKTKKPVSIKERQNVVRFCTEIDGVMKGKQVFTTTVEPEKGEEENYEFQEMTANSNPLERNANNRTTTGLYTYFLPAQRGMMFDEYGFPQEEKALEFINNTIEDYKAKGDTRGMSSFKRKNPRNFKEAFSADGELALYDPELLNTQLDRISWTTHFTEFGDLKWEDDIPFKKVIENADGSKTEVPNKLIWVPNPKGRYERVKGWVPKEANNVILRGSSFKPNNIYQIRLGCDPFRYDKTKDKRRSNCACFAYQMKDELEPTNFFNDMLTLRYSFRASSTREANMDVLKMAWWCGGRILFERNVNHWKNDLIDWNCADFFAWIPGEVEPGIITSGNAVQNVCNVTEQYINKHIGNVYFKTLIRKDTGWLGFKVEDTEKFDEPMGAGITLLHTKMTYRNSSTPHKPIEKFFRKTAA
jgi:hypothetical protein